MPEPANSLELGSSFSPPSAVVFTSLAERRRPAGIGQCSLGMYRETLLPTRAPSQPSLGHSPSASIFPKVSTGFWRSVRWEGLMSQPSPWERLPPRPLKACGRPALRTHHGPLFPRALVSGQLYAALRGGVFPTAGGNQAKEGQQSSKIPFESAAVKRVYMPTAGGDSLLSLSPLIWRMGRIPTPISLAGNTY